MDIINKIKEHFEEEAQEYDGIIKNLIPYYHQMVEAVVGALPFEREADFEVIDLGCGTGTVARAVKDAFPQARVTCLDISQNMLQIAETKLKDTDDTTYINSNFYEFDFHKKYDATVSSLALHHLVTNEDKLNFYMKIYSGLNPGGIFVNADVVLGSTAKLQELYMDRWKTFMRLNVSEEEVQNNWIPKYYEEDRPVSLIDHFEMLRKAGFITFDVIWKYYNFAVYMAVKEG